MNCLSVLSSAQVIADLVQDPLEYIKYRGYYPDNIEKTIQVLALFNIVGVSKSLLSTKESVVSLKEHIKKIDYRSIISSSIHIASSTFDLIRYTRFSEEALRNCFYVSSLVVPQIDFIGVYVLGAKILLGGQEIYESCVFLSRLGKTEIKVEEYTIQQAFIRNTCSKALEEVLQIEKISQEQIKGLQSIAELALMKKVAQLAVHIFRFMALFVLQNVTIVRTLLFLCKVSKPIMDAKFTKSLNAFSFAKITV